MIEEKFSGSLSETLKTYVFVAKNIIPKNLCEKLILKEKNIDNSWTKHEWTRYDDTKKGLTSFTSNKKEDSFIVKNILNQELNSCVEKSIELYLQVYNLPGPPKMVNNFSPLRINRYLVGTQMTQHFDHIFSVFDGKRKGIPILSLVGLLNDDFEGGHFHFYGSVVPLEAGDILIFPSCFLYPHGVTEVTKGERWSFVSWCY